MGTAIFVLSATDLVIEDNLIDYQNSSEGIAGIRVTGGNVKINANIIKQVPLQVFPYSSYTGIYLENSPGERSLISNNIVTDSWVASNGIYVVGHAVDIFHNTVVFARGAWSIATHSLVLSQTNSIRVKNNIFIGQFIANSTNDIVVTSGTNTGLEFDYNLLYSQPFYISLNGVVYNSLEAWQDAGFGANSHSFWPELNSDYPFLDPHLANCSIDNEDLFGTGLTEVPLDVDGDIRDKLMPYIGADEVFGSPPPLFEPAQNYDVADVAVSFTAGDFDQDGVDDIAVINEVAYGNRELALYFNNGAGVFSDPVNLPFGESPTIVKAADLDNDGLTDLIVTTNTSPAVAWGLPDGAFAGPFELEYVDVFGRVDDVGVGDLDLDGDLDIVQVHFGTVGVEEGWITEMINVGERQFEFADAGAPVHRVGSHPFYHRNGTSQQ